MKYDVYFLEEAEHDLEIIFMYLKKAGVPNAAKKLIQDLRKICISLSDFPERGHVPPELFKIENFEYREIHLKVYRILYQIVESKIYIYAILDGRRNIRAVLEQRALI